MSSPSAHPSLIARLAEIRQEVAGLLGDIDTRVKPRPDRMVPARDNLPGPVWEPVSRWTIRVVDPDEAPPHCVFVNHPYIWDDEIIPLDPDKARRVGMAFLAAADWADRLRSGAVGVSLHDTQTERTEQ